MALENDEIRRTNVERRSKHECANNSDHGAAFAFVIRFRNSFAVGNSSFVIHNGAPPSDRLSDQSFTSSDNGAENRAEMEPPEVEPSTLPATFSRLMPPPLLST